MQLFNKSVLKLHKIATTIIKKFYYFLKLYPGFNFNSQVRRILRFVTEKCNKAAK